MTTAEQVSFTCPRCHMTSYNPHDAEHGYCGNCHDFTRRQPGMLLLPGGEHPVAGHCPMGCGETLFLRHDGHIRCALIGCPQPDAVDRILADPETEHVVQFGEADDGFAVLHPLRERLGGPGGASLFTCGLNDHIARLPGPPVTPGRYRARLVGGAWTWDALPAATAAEGA